VSKGGQQGLCSSPLGQYFEDPGSRVGNSTFKNRGDRIKTPGKRLAFKSLKRALNALKHI
jgi:hypothetical protein